MFKFLIVNGPNLNMLGDRESEHYGRKTLDQIKKITEKRIKDSGLEVELTWVQSNIEGELVSFIQGAKKNFDGIVINPGGYSHTSVSILDALKIFEGVKAEVHLSKLSGRVDDFRKKMVTAGGIDILLEGLKELSYFMGVFSIYSIIKDKDKK